MAGLRQGVMLAQHSYAAQQSRAARQHSAGDVHPQEGSNFDGSISWRFTGQGQEEETLFLSYNQYPYRYYPAGYDDEKIDAVLSGSLQLGNINGKKTVSVSITVRGADSVSAIRFTPSAGKTLVIGGSVYTADEFYEALHTFDNEERLYDKEKECALALIILMASINELEWGASNPFFEIGGRLADGRRAVNWRRTVRAVTRNNAFELTYTNYYLNKYQSIFPFSIDTDGKMTLKTQRRGDFLSMLTFDGKLYMSGMRTFSEIRFDSCQMRGDVFTGTLYVDSKVYPFNSAAVMFQRLYGRIFL